MILAAGATGRLLPVVDALLAQHVPTRVTARDPGSPVARRLAGRGVQVVKADLDDPGSLRVATEGVDVVFAAGSPHQAGPEGERRHGLNVARAVADDGGQGGGAATPRVIAGRRRRPRGPLRARGRAARRG